MKKVQKIYYSATIKINEFSTKIAQNSRKYGKKSKEKVNYMRNSMLPYVVGGLVLFVVSPLVVLLLIWIFGYSAAVVNTPM